MSRRLILASTAGLALVAVVALSVAQLTRLAPTNDQKIRRESISHGVSSKGPGPDAEEGERSPEGEECSAHLP